MSPAKSPCPGLYGEPWQKTHAANLDFLNRFGAQAVDLGWTDLERFAIHPVIGTGRADYCGALVLTGRQVEATDAQTVRYGNLTYYRTQVGNPHPRLRGIPIWAFRG
ncbi:hypothetical protein DK427_24875 [Methylobacterium radiodurans]|uniref:Uncharacterized protein n=1 Tax=Methylobacterium radiodurans TaxID=2202828 RepID=A0A2U8VZL9_9HYPH|nr:hypothetical protein DK427_24875 [Methylobacterium radiodurans]